MKKWRTAQLVAALILAPAASPQAQEIDPTLISRPATSQRHTQDRNALVELGKRLWTYEGFGSNGQSCNSCHGSLDTYSETFGKPYPHFVQIVKDKAGLDQVDAEQMVQFCVVVPLAGRPLSWSSQELAALTAYVEVRQKLFAELRRPQSQGSK
jgi:cytochrome c